MDDLSAERIILYLEEFVRTTRDERPGAFEAVALELDLSDDAFDTLLERAEVVRENELVEETHPHLTDEQRAEIHEKAEEWMFDDLSQCAMDARMVSRFLSSAFEAKTTQDYLELISSDPEVRRDVLGFDPETGEEV